MPIARHPPRGAAGFTLLELLTTVSVLALLLAIAAPSMTKLVSGGRIRAASTDLISDLLLARSAAVNGPTEVKVRPSASGWTGGWTVQNAAGTVQYAKRSALGSGVAVVTAPDMITFGADGRVVAAGTVRIGLSDGSRYRCISLDPSGLPKSTTTECTP